VDVVKLLRNQKRGKGREKSLPKKITGKGSEKNIKEKKKKKKTKSTKLCRKIVMASKIVQI
jgi:hypothetical protein